MKRKITKQLRGSVKSMTIWFNGILASLVVGLPEAVIMLPQLQEYLPADLYRPLMAVAIIGNILLRFRTTTALEDKDATQTSP